MFAWLKKMLSGSGSSDLVEQNRPKFEGKRTVREWQIQWHDLFDVDSELIAAGDFERPKRIPDDEKSDFRLIFGLPHATSKTRQYCFSLFPSGPEMHKRFEDFLKSNPAALSEVKARARLTKVIALIEVLRSNDDLDFSVKNQDFSHLNLDPAKAKVVDRDTKDGLGELSKTGDILELIETSSASSFPFVGREMISARYFLAEPLYAVAGNYNEVANWVTAAMIGGVTDDLYTELYKLWTGGWQAAVGMDGLVLASRKI